MNKFDILSFSIFAVFCGGMAFITYSIGSYIVREALFFIAPVERVESTLISAHFSPYNSHYIPIYTGRGVRHGGSYSFHKECYSTVWDCKNYGRIGSSNDFIFRYAQEKSLLLVKSVGKEVRIVGIEI